MATTFSEVRRFVRKIVGDHDDRKHQFADETIDDHLRLVIMELNESLIVEGADQKFTQDLSNQDKVRVIFRTARSLVSPVPNEFSYKTPILSVRRKGAISQLLQRIDSAIDTAEGGGFAAISDTFWDTFFDGPDMLIDEISEASH